MWVDHRWAVRLSFVAARGSVEHCPRRPAGQCIGPAEHCLSTNQEARKVHEHPHRGRQSFGRDLAVSGSAEPLPYPGEYGMGDFKWTLF
jgi:hypothetical protein